MIQLLIFRRLSPTQLAPNADRTFRRALQALADSEGDVDAYIALIPVEDLERPSIGAAVGRRLLAAGRAKEAFAALERVKPKPPADRSRQYDELYELGYLRGPDDV